MHSFPFTKFHNNIGMPNIIVQESVFNIGMPNVHCVSKVCVDHPAGPRAVKIPKPRWQSSSGENFETKFREHNRRRPACEYSRAPSGVSLSSRSASTSACGTVSSEEECGAGVGAQPVSERPFYRPACGIEVAVGARLWRPLDSVKWETCGVTTALCPKQSL